MLFLTKTSDSISHARFFVSLYNAESKVDYQIAHVVYVCVGGEGGSQDDSSFRLRMESLFVGSVTDTKNAEPNSNDVCVYIKKTYL